MIVGYTKYIGAFVFFWLLALLFYFKTAGAGLVADSIGWIQIFEQNGWSGISNAFGDKSLHFVYQTVFFLLWKLFGLNGYAWMFLFITLHACIATLAYNIFSTLFSKEEIKSGGSIAFAGSLLFVVSPYLTETLVWYACIHYLVSVLLLLSSFRLVLAYLKHKQVKYILAFYCCYIVALFSLELSFVLPVLLFVFFLFWPPKILYGTDKTVLLKTFVLPTFCLVLLYFLLSKIFRGSVVGHYGAQAHLNFHLPLLTGNLAKYLLKIFAFIQFAPYKHAALCYAFVEHEKFGWIFAALLIAGLLGFLFFYQKLSAKYRISLLLFSFFVIALLPVLNLFITTIVNVESDRFTYFASIFIYPFTVLFCVSVFRKFGWVLLGVLLFFQVKFLQYNTQSWANSAAINRALTTNFKWSNAPQIYLLNMPDNFRGAYLFRGFPPENSFAITMWVKANGNFTPRVKEILLYNMTSLTDGVNVQKISDTELKVTFAQWGNWWWWKGVGAKSYATDDYAVAIDDDSHAYRIAFTQKKPGTVYLYQVGGEWKEVEGF